MFSLNVLIYICINHIRALMIISMMCAISTMKSTPCSMSPPSAVVGIKASSQLWHNPLGHPSCKIMIFLV